MIPTNSLSIISTWKFCILGSSTLPRTTTKATDTDLIRSEKPATTASTTSLYDNVTASNNQGQQTNTGMLEGLSDILIGMNKTEHQNSHKTNGNCFLETLQRQKSDTSTMTNMCTGTTSVGTQQNHIGLQISQDDSSDKNVQREETSKSEGTQAGGTLQNQKQTVKTSISTGTGTRSKDYNENIMHDHQISSSKRSKSKSTEDMNMDPSTLKKMLKPLHSTESPVTSPEMGRRRYNYYNAATNTMPHNHQHIIHNAHLMNNNSISRQSSQSSRFSGSRYFVV